MMCKIIKRLFRRKPVNPLPSHALIQAKQVGIQRQQMSPAALKVVGRLQENGYAAYIVGGAVRDALLGQHPKDFDVATDATPEEARRLFNRARIIGKRFRIVHVPFRDEIIEVTTFRGDSHAPTDASGRILHDNVYGSIENDARRRDFTFNALYYDPFKEIIVDYHNGVADLKARKLMMIGKPVQRYREDPVRILRAIRLAAKLHVTIDTATHKAIADCAVLLHNVPNARLFDETLKMLHSGESWQCLLMMREEGLHHDFFPLFDTLFAQPESRIFLENALRNTDMRIHQDKPVSSGFLFAALLWYEVMDYWKKRTDTGEHSIPALFSAMDDVLAIQEEKLAIPRRFSSQMKEIWMLQPRFEQCIKSRVFRLLAHPRFRAGYDFLLLRATADHTVQALANWWTSFQEADEVDREHLLQQVQSKQKKKRPKKKPKVAHPLESPQ
jgi:poly(A) polymerase